MLDSSATPEPEFSEAPPPAEPLEDFKKAANEGIKDAKEKWDTFTKEADKYIRENPGKSVLTALGVGLVLGLLLKD